MRLNIGDELAVVSIVTLSGEEIRPMTQEEINSHNSEFDDYVNWELTKKYAEDRAEAYASLQEQADMQYWDSVNGTTVWQDHIAEIKAKYPKE